MKNWRWMIGPAVLGCGLATAPISAVSQTAAPKESLTITLGARTACVTPQTTRQARTDGGIIEILLPSPNVLIATMTGTAAANAILGCDSSATQIFHLEQEFEVGGSGPTTQSVAMTLESDLVGLVRARHKASASAHLATAKICPIGWPDTPLLIIHPPFDLGGTSAKLCNQRLPPIKVPAMPPGQYRLTADFVLEADAGGITDGHSVADFSPSTALPADWVRVRDPFQGVDKKDFGFRISLTLEAGSDGTTATAHRSNVPDLSIKRARFNPDSLNPNKPVRPVPELRTIAPTRP